MSHEPSPCANCSHVDRRQFLASASVLSLGVLASACGDGVISGPVDFPDFPSKPMTVDPRAITALSQVGGRTVVSQGLASPVLIERVAATAYRGFSLVCPHRGTIVDVDSSGFYCPNHGARFDGDGTWRSGQPTVNLSPVAVTLNADGTLNVGGTPQPPVLALSARTAAFQTTLTSTAPIPVQTIAIANGAGGLLKGVQVSLVYGINQRTGWLTVQMDQPNAPATLTLSAQRGSLVAGLYTATVTITAPSATNPPQTVAVSLLVQDPASVASLQLSSTAVEFVASQSTVPVAQTVQCSNGGGGTLNGLAAQVNYAAGATGWLTASLSGTTAPATLTLTPNITRLAVGSYSATVVVSGTNVAARSIMVTVTVTPGGLVVTIAQWPALANVGGVAGSVGNVNGGPVAVTRTGASSFAAFSMRCPHQGTVIAVVNNTSFRCPNHGALFSATGVNQPNSPQRTDNLTPLTVVYTPGATTFTVS